MKSKFVCVLLILSSASALCQKPRQYMKLGEKARNNNDWAMAYAYFEQAFLLDSSSFEICKSYAECAREINYYALAERLYQKLYDKDKGRLFPEGIYWLAAMQKMGGKYDQALKNFKKYIKKSRAAKTNYLYLSSEHEIDALAWVMNYRQPVDTCEVRILSGEVNTGHSEVAPVWKDNELFFTRLLPITYEPYQNNFVDDKRWDVYRGHLRDTVSYDTNRVLIEGTGNLKAIANLSYSPDGRLAYFSAVEKGIMKKDVFIMKCEIEDGLFVNAKRLAAVNIEGYNSTMPHVANIDGVNVLFYSTNFNATSKFDYDLWIAELDADGNPKKPSALDGYINTPGSELSPFYTNGTLYFSSSWHFGFGGFDIFKSTGKPGSFAMPENMGLPINTSFNDLYFSYYPEFDKAFLSSNRGSIDWHNDVYTTCCSEIFMIDFVEEEKSEPEFASLDELNKFLPVKLYFHNDEPNPDSWDTTTTVSYAEAYNAYKKLYNTYVKENTKGLDGFRAEDAEMNIEQFFEFQVDKGWNDLQIFCGLLLKELEEGKRIRISIRGFASPRAQTDYNVNLTRRRTGSLVNYLSNEKSAAFLQYINGTAANGGRLEFVELPFGEYKADKSVSDDLFNERQSIYSREASLERKIEIESVSIIPQEPKAVLDMQESFDFGKIRSSEPAEHVFEIRNTGNAPLVIDSLQASCGCTTPSLDRSIILPGESANLKAGFDPLRKKGRQVVEVYLFVHNEPLPHVITIMADVE